MNAFFYKSNPALYSQYLSFPMLIKHHILTLYLDRLLDLVSNEHYWKNFKTEYFEINSISQFKFLEYVHFVYLQAYYP